MAMQDSRPPGGNKAQAKMSGSMQQMWWLRTMRQAAGSEDKGDDPNHVMVPQSALQAQQKLHEDERAAMLRQGEQDRLAVKQARKEVIEAASRETEARKAVEDARRSAALEMDRLQSELEQQRRMSAEALQDAARSSAAAVSEVDRQLAPPPVADFAALEGERGGNSRVKNLEEEVLRLRTESYVFAAQNEELSQRLEEIYEAPGKLDAEVYELQEQLSQQAAQVREEQEKDFKELQADRNALLETHSSLLDRHAQLLRDSDTLRSQSLALEEERDDLQRKLSGLQALADDAASDREKEHHACKESEQAERKALMEKHSSLVERHAQLERDSGSLRSRCAALERERDDLSQKIGVLQALADGAAAAEREQLAGDTAASAAAAAAAAAASGTAAASKAEAQLPEGLQDELESMREKHAVMQQEFKQLHLEIVQHRVRADTSAAERDVWEAEANRLRHEQAMLAEEQRQLGAEAEKLRAARAALQKAHSALVHQVKEAQDHSDCQRTVVLSLESTLQKMETQDAGKAARMKLRMGELLWKTYGPAAFVKEVFFVWAGERKSQRQLRESAAAEADAADLKTLRANMAESQAENSLLQEEVGKLRRRNEALLEEVGMLTDGKATMPAALQDGGASAEEVNRLAAENIGLREELELQRDKYAAVDGSRRELEVELEELYRQLDEKKSPEALAPLEGLREELAKLREENEYLRASCHEGSKENEVLKDAAEQLSESHRLSLAQAEDRHTELLQELERHREDGRAMLVELEGHRGEAARRSEELPAVEDHRRDNERLLQELETLRQERDGLSVKHDALENHKRQLEDEFGKVKAMAATVEHHRNRAEERHDLAEQLKAERQQLAAEAERLRLSHGELQAERDSLHGRLREHSSRADAAEEGHRALQATVEEMRATRDVMLRKHQDLQEELQRHHKSRASLEGHSQQATQTVEEMKQQLERALAAKAAVEAAAADLQETNRQLAATVQDLTMQLKKSRQGERELAEQLRASRSNEQDLTEQLQATRQSERELTEQLQEAFFRQSEERAAAAGSHATASESASVPAPSVEDWVSQERTSAPPVDGTQRRRYSDKVTLRFSDFEDLLRSVSTVNDKHRMRMVADIESGGLAKSALETFKAHDTDGRGDLEFHSGEVCDFLAAVFLDHNLQPPTEAEMYHVYKHFDREGRMRLPAVSCLQLVDALVRATFRQPGPPRTGSSRFAYGGSPAREAAGALDVQLQLKIREAELAARRLQAVEAAARTPPAPGAAALHWTADRAAPASLSPQESHGSSPHSVAGAGSQRHNMEGPVVAATGNSTSLQPPGSVGGGQGGSMNLAPGSMRAGSSAVLAPPLRHTPLDGSGSANAPGRALGAPRLLEPSRIQHVDANAGGVVTRRPLSPASSHAVIRGGGVVSGLPPHRLQHQSSLLGR
eukprot:TRINITY_DN45593_c0_g1_i1.p1 TRINITY_DN45593_c0_g1~~TRINITY_DN45593_c0_g1_i1.p1  ORF type:complete len:1421 (-),score=498.67 TRINITY_DN45593_c0_g1_i1:284-4546(-)